MSKTITSQIITRESLINYENALVLGNKIDYSYSDQFGQGNQIGQQLYIRRPILVAPVINNMAYGSDAVASATETYVAMSVATTLTQALTFSDEDMTLRIEDFEKRFIKKATTVMANVYDNMIADAISNAGKLWSQNGKTVGTATGGTTAISTGVGGWVFESATSGKLDSADINNALVLLNISSCPTDERYGVLSADANAKLASSQITLLNPTKEISDIYKSGFIMNFAGVDWFMSQTVATHTNGAQGTLAIGAGTATYTTGWQETGILTVTATAGAINAGDVFSIPGVFVVNPLTKAVTNQLQHFTAVAHFAIGSTSIEVSPAPISAGPYQNVSAAVTSKTATLVGSTGTSYVESYVFHKEAIAAASPKLYSREGQVEARSEETGVALRFTRAYDPVGARPSANGVPGWVNRLDIIAGIKIVRPEWVVRIRIKP